MLLKWHLIIPKAMIHIDNFSAHNAITSDHIRVLFFYHLTLYLIFTDNYHVVIWNKG